MNISGFVDYNTDAELVKSIIAANGLENDELCKGILSSLANKLTGKNKTMQEVQVHGKNGVYTRKQWVSSDTSDTNKKLQKQSKELGKMAKKLDKQQKKINRKTKGLDDLTNKYLANMGGA